MGAPVTRRAVLLGIGTTAVLAHGPDTRAETALPRLTVTKDPSCGCCSGWVDHMRASGFEVEVVETPAVARVRTRLGVPQDLASCHTGEIGGYVLEGHVPAPAVKRLLAERPPARGLAVPGMPMGSPGMDADGVEPDTYEVVLFGPAGRRTFARYKGGRVM